MYKRTSAPTDFFPSTFCENQICKRKIYSILEIRISWPLREPEKKISDVMFFTLKLHANGCNKSKHCWANNVGTCSVSWDGYNP